MLLNVEKIEMLAVLARHRKSSHETKSVRKSSVQDGLPPGWTQRREYKTTVQLVRRKDSAVEIRDRLWFLLYRLGVAYLSADNPPSVKVAEGKEYPFDVVAVDDEVALAIRCLSSERPSRLKGFDAIVRELSESRSAFASAIKTQFPRPTERLIVTAIFLKNIHVTPHERKLAREYEVVIFDERDLGYYEGLVGHLGSAAKYQLLADMLPGEEIPGLSLTVPAIRSRMGSFFCYAFSVSPAYLLKICYISHRSKGKPSDIGTYQRMVSKTRLKRVREYISEDGIFPTNIVLSLESSAMLFQPSGHAATSVDPELGVPGSLKIKGAFKAAWIIDGQHRLFAYSGHSRANDSRLAVLAFEGLPLSTQAQLFIDINAKQKSVPPGLLQELYADLKWSAEDPKARIAAIISRAIQELGNDPESPFFGRIRTVDSARSEIRCISLTSMFNELERGSLFIGRERGGKVVEYGPLGAGDNELALNRTIMILSSWIQGIVANVSDWWELGAAQGGGLAMNDAVASLFSVLRSVLQHLESDGERLSSLSDAELRGRILPYAAAVGEYLASFSEADRKKFRDLRGNQGLSARNWKLQQAVRDRVPGYNPPGLDEFIELERQQTNSRGDEIIRGLEIHIQRLVLAELRQQIGADESQWWTAGVPRQIRKKATERYEDDDGKRGGREFYLDLIDYRAIIQGNWSIFEEIFGRGTGNKDKRTSWMNVVNEKRRIVAHASSGRTLSLDDVAELEEIDQWFSSHVLGVESY